MLKVFCIEIGEIFVVGNWESLVLDRTHSAPNQTLNHVQLFPVCEKLKGCLAIFEQSVIQKIWSCVVLTVVNFISLVAYLAKAKYDSSKEEDIRFQKKIVVVSVSFTFEHFKNC